MKLTSAIPLFCAALLGYLSFTRQSSAPSTGKTVAKQPNCQGTQCTFDDAIGWVMVNLDDDDDLIKTEDYEILPEKIEEPKDLSDAQTGNGLFGENGSSNQNCSHLKGISQAQESEMNPIDAQPKLKKNLNASTTRREIKKSGRPLNNLSELPNMIKSDVDKDLWLDLTDDSCLPHYTEANFSSWKYSKIFLQMNEQSNLSLLTKAFSGRTVTDFNININSNEKNLDKLFEIIKDEKFKSLLFYHFQSNNEHAEKFVENLGNEDSFWSEMEYLDLWNFPKNQIIKTLSVLSKLYSKITSNPSKYKPLKLKKLSIIIDRTNYESIDNLNIPFIEELDLRFYHYGVYLRDIDSILPIFPNIKKLSIYVSSELEYFEIGKNAELEELEIKCETLKEEDKFVKYLKENTNLTSFRIRQYYEEDIEWIRDLPAKKKIKLK